MLANLLEPGSDFQKDQRFQVRHSRQDVQSSLFDCD